MKYTLHVGMLMGALLFAGWADAKSTYQNSFTAAYPSANNTRIDSCQICHVDVDPDVDSSRNLYGVAWKNAGKSFLTIESFDSDGDLFSNLTEIQSLTFPGNTNDKPTTGSLTVYLEPAGARSAGAKWRISPGGVYKNSGETVPGLAAGSLTVQFLTVSGWETPLSKQVTILAGQTVTATATYVLSTVSVPDLAGMTEAAAQSTITSAGLLVGLLTQEYSSAVPAGEVISQNPIPDTSVVTGTAVDLVISLGPAPPEGEGESVVEVEGEETLEGEGESPSEGEAETCGCFKQGAKDVTFKEMIERTLGDWLLVGLSSMTLAALGTRK